MINKYGGMELFFTFPPNDYRSFTIITNVDGLPQYGTGDLVEISFRIAAVPSSSYIRFTCYMMIGTAVVDYSDYSFELSSLTNISELESRVVMSDNAVSIYCNDLWVYTYVFGLVNWPDVVQVALKNSSASQDVTVTNIRLIELADPREAVYIDYEATVDSAIQSIIQQRPIQIFPEVGREIAFTYSAVKDVVGAHHVTSYEEATKDSQSLSSDGLVYYTDVAISVSRKTAEEVGLITKLYRLSELNSGALNAAARLQKLALERRKMVTINMRLDPRIEIADNLLIDEILSGTGTHIVDNVIVEDVSISIQNGNYSMRILARRK